MVAYQERSHGLPIDRNLSENVPSHFWLIYINHKHLIDRGNLSALFRKTPLRLDSYVFAFLQTEKGKIIATQINK